MHGSPATPERTQPMSAAWDPSGYFNHAIEQVKIARGCVVARSERSRSSPPYRMFETAEGAARTAPRPAFCVGMMSSMDDGGCTPREVFVVHARRSPAVF